MSAGFSITISAVDAASARIDAVNKKLASMRAPVERVSKSLATFARLSGIEAVGKGFDRMARGAFSAFQSIARVVSPLAAITGAASVAGMYRLVEAWGQWGSQLGFAAARIGLSATQLQVFQGAALLAGSSAGAMTTGLLALGQSMYDAIGGRAPETVALLNQLGIAFDDGTRHARNVSQVLPELANRIASIKDPYTQARIATQLFGGAAESLLPFLRRGAAGIADLEDRSRRYGVTSAAGVAAANQLREAQADLTLSVQGFGNSISEKVAPYLTKLLDWMAELISKNRAWIATGIGQKVGEFAAYLKAVDWKAVEGGFESFAHRADSVAQAFGGWKRVLEGIVAIKLAGWAASAIAPFTGVLRLLALIPGSGVTAAELAAVGIADLAVGSVGSQGEVREGHTGFGKFIYDHSSSLRYLDNYMNGTHSARQSTPSTAEQSAKAAQAMAYFQSQGWSRAQAAGMAANIQAESGFNPSITGDNGSAYGLGQWHADRQANFKKWAGHDIRNSTFDEQLGFFNHELTSGSEQTAGQNLRLAQTPAQAGEIVSLYDERPAGGADEGGARGMLAESIGHVGVRIEVVGGGVQKVTATSKGNVGTPKVMRTGVGAANGGT